MKVSLATLVKIQPQLDSEPTPEGNTLEQK